MRSNTAPERKLPLATLRAILFSKEVANPKPRHTDEITRMIGINGRDPSPETETPEQKIEKSVLWEMCGIVAKRFQRGQIHVPLIRKQDIPKLVRPLAEHYVARNPELNTTQQRDYARSLRRALQKHITILLDWRRPEKDYRNLQKVVRAALQLAKERGVEPDALFTTEGAHDVITRRTTTPRQFRKDFLKTEMSLLQMLLTDEAVLKPLSDSTVDRPSQRRAQWQQFKATLLPLLKQTLREAKVAAGLVADREIARIWPETKLPHDIPSPFPLPVNPFEQPRHNPYRTSSLPPKPIAVNPFEQ